MLKQRRISVENIYVPDIYKVMLNPKNWESIGSFHKFIIIGTTELFIIQSSKEKFYISWISVYNNRKKQSSACW